MRVSVASLSHIRRSLAIFMLNSDLIIVLQDGAVAEQGSHEDLMTIQGGVYRRLWEAQLTESTSAIKQEVIEVEKK